MKFTDLDLEDSLQEGLKAVQFDEATPIQEQAIPLILDGKDVIGAAQTGTGKTGAFVIPLIDRILKEDKPGIRVLILSPTRELASQIDEQVFAIGYHAGVGSATVKGGSDFNEQAKALRAGVPIVVATPGRLLDQMNIVNPDFSNLSTLVLDEADRMLDMGFLPDVSKIIEEMPKQRQTLLFSATMPGEVKKLADKFMKNPEKVEIEASKPAENVEQRIYHVDEKKKNDLVKQLFKKHDWKSAIIFSATKKGVDALEHDFRNMNIDCVSMHGDRSQEEREDALRKFKNGTYPVMVATDVLARGIDIDNVSIIINYNVPRTPDDYIHRIGRTGRYKQTGMAITLVSSREKKYYNRIKDVVGDQLTQMDLPDARQQKERKRSSDSKNKSDKKSTGTRKKRPRPSGNNNKGKNKRNPRTKKDSDTSDKQQKQPKQKKQKKESSEKKQAKKDKNRQSSRNKSGNKSGRRSSKKRSKDRKKGRSKKSGGRGSDNSRRRKESKQEQREKTRKRRKSEKPQDKRKEKDYDVVEKAVHRNKKSRKPSKGVWGVIKSLIPKL